MAISFVSGICFPIALCVVVTAVSAEDNSAPRDNIKTVSFQRGVSGFTQVVDTEIWALAPNTILESNPNASSDANNDGGESQVLLRFEGIFGNGPDQIPLGSRIAAARLEVSAFDQGSTVHLHRMLIPFTASATWNSLIAGASADGVEASRHKDSLTFGQIAANSSTVLFNVTDTLQLWSSGKPNYGWVFINTGGNGWDFYTSDHDDIKQRPKLVVEFEPKSDGLAADKQAINLR